MTYLAFDVDGTLYDCGDIVLEAFQRGARAYRRMYPGAPVHDPTQGEIITVIGIPTDEIFQRLYPELDVRGQSLMNDLCTHELSQMVREGGGHLFEGVTETLRSLTTAGYVLLLASNGKKPYLDAILQTHGLEALFSPPVILIDGNIRNKRDIVQRYKTGIAAGSPLIMIGDRHSDRDAAEDNGIPFIGCAFGHAGASEIEDTQWVVHDFREIPGQVMNILNGKISC